MTITYPIKETRPSINWQTTHSSRGRTLYNVVVRLQTWAPSFEGLRRKIIRDCRVLCGDHLSNVFWCLVFVSNICPRQRRAHVFTICDACFSFSFHGNLGVKDDHWTNPLEFLRGNEDAITLFPERLPATLLGHHAHLIMGSPAAGLRSAGVWLLVTGMLGGPFLPIAPTGPLCAPIALTPLTLSHI